MIVEFSVVRGPARESKSEEKIALDMPQDIAERFQAHLRRKHVETPAGRKALLAAIESEL